MRHLLVKYTFLFLSLMLAGQLVGQRYNFYHFSVEDGLAQNQILGICQDSRGYMWFGTNNGGVSIYDGTHFSTLTKDEGLATDLVYSIIEDSKGDLIFGTNGGVTVYDRDTFITYTTEDGLPHNRVFTVFEDKDGNIWLGTAAGIARLGNEGIEQLTDRDSSLLKVPVFSIFQDSKENIWFGSMGSGALRYDGKEIIQYTNPGNCLPWATRCVEGLKHRFARTIVEDTEGNIWVGTPLGFNMIDRDENITERKIHSEESAVSISYSLMGRDSVLWFATGYGLVSYKDGVFQRFDTESGLVTNILWTVFEDREGNMWIGTSGNGLIKFRYRGGVFRNYSKVDGLPQDNITTIFEDSKGSYWIGTSSGITRMKGKQIETFTRTNENNQQLGIASDAYCVTEDDEGNIWIANRQQNHGAVFKYDGESFTSYGSEEGFPSNIANFIMQDKEGAMWVGTQIGVTVIYRDSVFNFDDLNGLQVWWIMQDSYGRYWFATAEGAAMFNGKTTRFFGKEDGFTDGRVRSILQDKRGYFWFTTNEGLFRYDRRYFHSITKKDGLSSNSIYLMLIDDKDRMWLGTSKGLDQFDMELYNSNRKVSIRHFGKQEGFIGMECNSNAALKDSKGHLWFGTVKGVTIFSPELESVNTREPLTSITNIRLEFKDYDWAPWSDSIIKGTSVPVNLVLPNYMNHLTFDFVGVSLIAPEKVQYQFMVEGLDEHWLPATVENEAVYPHIPPGTYTFKVRAMNNDGKWNKQPETFSFTILPPWYQTWWFYTLCIVLVLVSIYLFITIRMRALRKQKKVLEEQVQVRTAQLQEEKEKVEAINQEVVKQSMVIEARNRDITDSINYAQRIQEAMLPSLNRIRMSFRDSFVLYRPKDIVSGDFFWYGTVGEKSFIAAVDCTGHGVPGAFMSMIGHNLLDQIILRNNVEDPAEILKFMNSGVKSAFRMAEKEERQDGMDIALCVVENSTMWYAGAQRPLWLIRDGELQVIKGTSKPIGGFTGDEASYESHHIDIRDGDRIYIHSDGYQDQFGGPNIKKFMTKRMKQMVLDIHEKDMEAQQQHMEKTLDEWKGEEDQIDDILVIGLRF